MNSLSRRRYQKGQITRDGDRWVARWREDILDPLTGKPRRIRKWDVIASVKECPTKRLAQRKLDERLASINAEDYKPMPVSTFAAFAEKWKTAVMIHHKPSSQRSERSIVGKILLKMPRVVKGTSYHFSVAEVLQIIDKAQGRWKLFFRILAETGMRPGELAGMLTENCLPNSLRISQSVWQQGVQTVKSNAGNRTFAISERLGADIQKHIEESDHNRYGLLFVSTSGRPLSMDNFRNRVLNPILTELGILQKIRARGIRGGNYAFRHMNATLMDSLNAPLKTRQRRLGHSKVETTLTHYTHDVDADDVALAEQIGALLGPKDDGAITQ